MLLTPCKRGLQNREKVTEHYRRAVGNFKATRRDNK